LVIVSIVFIWQKRAYLQQLIPVVIQLIQQQYKWNQENTGTYVYKYRDNYASYLDRRLSPYLLFIKDKKVQRAMHIGNGYDLEYLGNRKQIETFYLEDYNKNRDSYYLIDERFNKIWSALWDNSFSFYVGYDEQYAYPKVLEWVWEDPVEYQKTITLDSDNSCGILSLELRMFDKDTEFNDAFLKKVLKEYKEQHYKDLKCRREPKECSELNQTIPPLEVVGGDILRGVVLKSI